MDSIHIVCAAFGGYGKADEFLVRFDIQSLWRSHLSFNQQGNSAAIGRHPEPSQFVFCYVVDDLMSQSIADAVICETVAVKTAQALLRGNPEKAFFVLIDRGDYGIGQTVGNIITPRREL